MFVTNETATMEKSLQVIRRKQKRMKDQPIVRFFRQLGFLTFSVFMRHTSWVSLPILSLALRIKYIFLVNAGSDSDLDGYCPRWLAKSWYFSGSPTIGGIMTDANLMGRGLVVVLPNTALELRRKRDVCAKMMRKLRRMKALTFSKSIALSGQIPGIVNKHEGLKIEKPFVKGDKGTVFCVMETISAVMKKHQLIHGAFRIAVVGVGTVGSKLLDTLREENHDVFGIDIKKRRGGGVVLKDEGQALLPLADMVVVLTPKGKDFNEYIPCLKKDAIVIDDTHPKITNQPKHVSFYKVAVGLDGVNFLPRLPGYKANWIPGCAVEAIYAVKYNDFNGTPQEVFNQRVKKIGFFAHLVR